jgi:hypothetical protein
VYVDAEERGVHSVWPRVCVFELWQNDCCPARCHLSRLPRSCDGVYASVHEIALVIENTDR